MTRWSLPRLPPHWAASAQPRFVGRERELEVLESLWPRVEAGARQVVFVGGEPGAGKTRLAIEAGLALHRAGVRVLHGGCTPDFGEPFDPFVEPVRTLLPDVADDALALEADDPVASLDLLGLVGGRPPPDADAPAAPRRRAPASPAVFEAVAGLLRSWSRDEPALLVLDDLQWAGDSALRMLRYVVERTEAAHLLVLVTMRTSAPDRSTSLSRVLGETFRLEGVRRIDLAGLDTDAIARYLHLGSGPPTPEVRSAAAVLRDETGGNPFLLREVCRDLEAAGGLGDLSAGGIRPPDSVRAMVEARLDDLAPPHRQVVRAASVIGDEFTVPLLAAALEEDGVDIASVFRALAAARALGLAETGAEAEAGSAYRFPHALARQAVMGTLGDYERALAHARVGLALEERFPSAPSRDQRLGHHFASATGMGLEDRASHYLAAAGDEAKARLAHADAGALYERAAALAPTPERRDDLLLQASQSHHFASQTGRALELAERVASTGAPSRRLRAAVGFEGASWRTAQPAGRSIQVLTAALALSDPDPGDPVYVRAIAGLGRAQAYAGSFTEGMRRCADAIDMARALDDPRLLASVLQVALQDGIQPEGVDDRLARANELSTLIEQTGEYHRMGAPAFHRCLAHYIRGEPTELARAHADLARAARDTQQYYWQWVLATVSSALAVSRGDAVLARTELDRSHGLGELIDRSETEGPWALQSFMLRREYGDLGPAGRLLRSGAVDPATMWAPGLTALYVELGWFEEAARALRVAIDHDLERHRRSASWPAVLTFLAEAATRLEDRAAAATLLPLAEQHASRNIVASEFLATFGSGHRLIGMLESVLGVATAGDHFAAALEMDRRMGAVLHEATTLAEHAVHLRRVATVHGTGSGGRVGGGAAGGADAVAQRAAARALAERHGLGRVLRILGPEPEPGADPRHPHGLTARELEVLALVGHGSSNRDIAAALFISEYTAANHVRSILMKTGSTNRTQAARYALDRGLLAGSEGDRAP